MEKHIPAKNVARFYRLALLPNLFGEWTLYREWGRIGQGGRIRLDCFATHEQALAALLALEARKQQRGYWVEPQQLTMFKSEIATALSQIVFAGATNVPMSCRAVGEQPYNKILAGRLSENFSTLSNANVHAYGRAGNYNRAPAPDGGKETCGLL